VYLRAVEDVEDYRSVLRMNVGATYNCVQYVGCTIGGILGFMEIKLLTIWLEDAN
jgi:hypothetical protein